MIVYILLILLILAAAAYYTLYFSPKRKIEKFALQVQQQGYKVKLVPFQFMQYYLSKYFRQDQGSLKVIKEEWSKYDIVVGNMLTNIAVLVANPTFIKDFCSQSSKLQKNPFIVEVFDMLNGGGIIFAQGQSWKRKRRIISEVFHFEFLNSIIPTIEDEIQQRFSEIDQKIRRGDKIVDLNASFIKILSNAVVKLFFGTDMKQYQIQGLPFCQYFFHFFNQMGAFSMSLEHILFGMKVVKYGLTNQGRNLKRKSQLISSIALELTKKQLEKLKNKEKMKKSILTALYQNNLLNLQGEQQNPNQYTLFELIGQFYAFFFAGMETTSNTLNVALHYLSLNQYQNYVGKICEQWKKVSKQNLKEHEKIKSLKICEAIFNQSLRANGSAALMIDRIAIEDITLGRITLPRGSTAAICPLMRHYNEQDFLKADQFNPQRWLSDKKLDPFVFIPFSGGQRNCIGQYLAKLQSKLILVRICQRYQFKAIHPIKMRMSFTLATEHGEFQMKIRGQ